MLGRLQMSIDDCIKHYSTLSKKVFPRQRLPEIFRYGPAAIGKPWYDAAVLEGEIRNILEGQGYVKNAPLRADTTCKVFVCAAVAENSTPELLRSYAADLINYDCTIVEAARATSAAPLFFAPVTFTKCGTRFIDGGMKANNPIFSVLSEALKIWPSRSVGCVVSLGTGVKDKKPFGEIIKLHKALAPLIEAAFDANGRAKTFEGSFEGRRLDDSGAYFRFNVERGMETIEFDRADQIEVMKMATMDYIRDADNTLLKCARRMTSNKSVSFKDRDANGDLLPLEEIEAMSKEFDLRQPTDFRDWIRPNNVENKLEEHHKLVAVQENDSTNWIFSVDQFKEWERGQQKVLWLSGRAGCGKSTIASSIIKSLPEALEADDDYPSDSFVGHAFCNTLLEAKNTNSTALCRTILWQAIKPNSASLSDMQKCSLLRAWRSSTSARPLQTAGPDSALEGSELYDVLRQHLSSFRRVSLVFDGLDECPDHEVLLKEMRKLVDTASLNCDVRLLFVSQDLPSISKHLSDGCVIRMDDDAIRAFTSHDIALFVEHALSSKDLPQDTTPQVKTEVQRIICSKAEGVFLWAALAMQQVIELAKDPFLETDEELVLAANRLPPEMSEICASYLERVIDQAAALSRGGRPGAKAMIIAFLKWIFHAKRPLKIAELCAALSLPLESSELSGSTITGFNSNERTLKRLVEFCYPILSLQDETISIMHSSLRDNILQQEPSANLSYHLGNADVQTQIAGSCLHYLQQKAFHDFIEISHFELARLSRRHALLDYAVVNWLPHLLESKTTHKEIQEFLSEFLKSWNAITWLEVWFRQENGSLSRLQGTAFSKQGKNEYISDRQWVVELLRKSIERRKWEAKEESFTIELMYGLASLLRERGELAQAEQLATTVHSYRKEHPDENKGEYQVYNAANLLAMILSGLRKFAQAEALYAELLPQLEKAYGAQSSQVLTVKNNLATLSRSTGKFARAEQLQREIYESRKRTLGETHRDTILSLHNLASCHLWLSNFEQAKDFATEAYNVRRRSSNPMEALQTLSDLAMAESGLGNYDEAAKHSKDAWQGREALLGPTDPGTLTSMINHGCVLLNLERNVEAEKVFREVISRKERTAASNTANLLSLLTTKSNLQVAVDKQGRHEEALQMCREITAKRREILGDDHMDVFTSINNLCNVLNGKGEFQEAVILAATNYTKARNKYGSAHQSIITYTGTLQNLLANVGMRSLSTYFNNYTLKVISQKYKNQPHHPEIIHWKIKLAYSAAEQGRWDEAEHAMKVGLEEVTTHLGPTHSTISGIYLNLGRSRLRRGDYAGAEEFARRGYGLVNDKGNRDPLNDWVATELIAEAYTKSGRLSEAMELLKQVKEARLEKTSAESQGMAGVYGKVADVQMKLGEYTHAEMNTRRASEILESSHGSDTLAVAWVKQTLANALRRQGKLEESAIYQRDALSTRQTVMGEFNFLTVRSRHDKAMLLFDSGRAEEAEQEMMQVVNIRKTILDPDHPEFIESLTEWNRIRQSIGLATVTDVAGVDLGTEYQQQHARLSQALKEALTLFEPSNPFIRDLKREIARLHLENGELAPGKVLLQDVLTDELVDVQRGDVQALQDLETVIDLSDEKRPLPDKVLQATVFAAIKAKRAGLVERLFEFSFDADSRDEETKCTVLGLAVIKGDDATVRFLLAQGFDVSTTEIDNKTALHLAAEKGHVEIMKQLIEAGADVNGGPLETDINKRPPPIWYAAREGHSIAVKALLDAKADPNPRGLDASPLHYAAAFGNIAIVDLLIQARVDLEVQTPDMGLTALCYAAFESKVDMVRHLLDAGARHDHLTLQGNSLLSIACEGGNLEIMEIFIQKGLSLEKVNNGGSRPIHQAALKGRTDILREIHRRGADLTVQVADSQGSTPMSLAARGGHTNFVKSMLDYGLDPNASNKDGRTSLHGAALLGKYDVLDTLLKAGANPNVTDVEGMSPLCLAIRGNFIDIVRCLLRAGASTTSGFKTTHSPLLTAVAVGDQRITSILLTRQDTNVDEPSIYGMAALHMAALMKNTDMMSLLLRAKASPNVKAGDGSTPLHIAARTLQCAQIEALVRAVARQSIRDCFGRKAIDWVGEDQQEALKLFSSHERTPLPAQTDIRRRNIVDTCRQIERGSANRKTYSTLATLLLLSQDANNAAIAIEVGITNPDVPDEQLALDLDCDMCRTIITGPVRICKACANCQICAACYVKYQGGERPLFCSHGDFQQVPRPCWRGLERDTVEVSGEKKTDWLRRVSAEYSTAV